MFEIQRGNKRGVCVRVKLIDDLRQLMYNEVTFLHCITWRNVNKNSPWEKNRVMMIRDYQLSQLASVSPISFHIPFLLATNAIKLIQLFTIFEAGSLKNALKWCRFSSGALVELKKRSCNERQVAWKNVTFLEDCY